MFDNLLEIIFEKKNINVMRKNIVDNKIIKKMAFKRKEGKGTLMKEGPRASSSPSSASATCASAGADGDRNEYTMRCKLVRLGMPRRASQSPGRLPPVAAVSRDGITNIAILL